MKRTKLFILLFPVLMMFAGTGAHALDIVVDFPAIIPATVEDDTEFQLHQKLDKYNNMTEFTRGFGNANTYASNGATMRGYQGYDLISIAVGMMYTVQAPSADPLFFQSIQDELDDGDVYTGIGANPLVGQVGLNMGFIIPDLYISFRFGKLDYKIDAGSYKLDYDTNLLGVIVDYQLIPSQSILAGILLWKGLNLESGFIYSTNNVNYYKDIDPFTFSSGAYNVIVDPSIDLTMDIKSYIIPVEIYSAFRLFYMINFGVGLGMDYVYDNTTDLTIHSAGTATIDGSGETGTITLDGGTEGEADKYRFKGMVNVGASIGPVFVDIPITFYLDNGYAVGLSAGIVW